MLFDDDDGPFALYDAVLDRRKFKYGDPFEHAKTVPKIIPEFGGGDPFVCFVYMFKQKDHEAQLRINKYL